MAAASLHQQHYHRPLKLYGRDDNNNDSESGGSNKSSGIPYSKQKAFAKRRSAVELLQETKPLYVKSETVLDKKQELSHRPTHCAFYPSYFSSTVRHFNLPSSAGTCFDDYSSPSITTSLMTTSSLPSSNDRTTFVFPDTNRSCSLPVCKIKVIPPPPAFRRSAGSSFQLQNKLRKLLDISKEDLPDAKEKKSDNCGNSRAAHMTLTTERRLFFSPVKNQTVPNGTSVYYKSLPDLSNTKEGADDDTSSDNNNEDGDFELNAYSCSSDEASKKSRPIDSVSAASCKNGQLYVSVQRINKCTDIEVGSGVEYADSASSPSKSCPDIISPPSMYCDLKINDFLSTNNTYKSCLVQRSKSDVGANSNYHSSLQTINTVSSQDVKNLNNFFDNLGMDPDEYSSLTRPPSDCFSSVYQGSSSSSSSVESVGGYTSGGEGRTSVTYPSEALSVVERNARIIKWLYNCRKVMQQQQAL